MRPIVEESALRRRASSLIEATTSPRSQMFAPGECPRPRRHEGFLFWMKQWYEKAQADVKTLLFKGRLMDL